MCYQLYCVNQVHILRHKDLASSYPLHCYKPFFIFHIALSMYSIQIRDNLFNDFVNLDDVNEIRDGAIILLSRKIALDNNLDAST
uniref:Uncharacterized protein n=1 Tax=Romanomermis culicivorax TaxID=13658 RepID=A0A915KRI5_ROMCU